MSVTYLNFSTELGNLRERTNGKIDVNASNVLSKRN
jgi:hypothetical protein